VCRALGRKLLLQAAPGLQKPRLARARDRVRLALAALVEALTGVTQPAAAALVDRPAARHRRRLLGSRLGGVRGLPRLQLALGL
jgi:hypothetical protein